jgi:hypothetical protein
LFGFGWAFKKGKSCSKEQLFFFYQAPKELVYHPPCRGGISSPKVHILKAQALHLGSVWHQGESLASFLLFARVWNLPYDSIKHQNHVQEQSFLLLFLSLFAIIKKNTKQKVTL